MEIHLSIGNIYQMVAPDTYRGAPAHHLGNVELAEGHHEPVRQYFREGLEYAVIMGGSWKVWMLDCFARLARAQNDHCRATHRQLWNEERDPHLRLLIRMGDVRQAPANEDSKGRTVSYMVVLP